MTQSKNGPKIYIDISPKQTYRWLTNTWKDSQHHLLSEKCKSKPQWEECKNGGGIGCGDHFLSKKFIERIFERWANSTKQLLNAGKGHQAPRNAAHSLWKEVGLNIKDKKRGKRVRDGDPSREGSLKRGEVSKHQETLSPASLWGVLETQRVT